MTREQKIKDLVNKGYTRAQAYLITNTLPKAQQSLNMSPQNMFKVPNIPDMYNNTNQPSNTPMQGWDNILQPYGGVPNNNYRNTFETSYRPTQEVINNPPRQNTISPIPTLQPRGLAETTMPTITAPTTINQYAIPANQYSNTQTVEQATPEQGKQPIYNPFGGISLEQSLFRAGQGIGQKDPWMATSGLGLSGLKLGRIGLSGYATGTENNRVLEEMQRKQFEDMRRPQMLQEGGDISNAAVMTGKFVVDQPNLNANVELERDEFVKDNQTGEIKKVVGDTHKNGGVKTNLEDAKILSDYTKIGAKNAKELKEKYNLSVKKTDTFAKVMEKANKKLGVDKIVKEQTEYIEKVGQNETIKSEGTKKVNDEFLSSQISEREEKLNELKGVQNLIFEDIFEKQEQIPKKGNGELLDAKGKPMQVNELNVMQEGGRISNLAIKYGISPERAQELIMMQQGGEQPMQEQPSQEQGISPEEIIQAFAQATQQDPNAIMEQIQQLAPEEQQIAIQQMMETLQGMMQEGQSQPQEEQMPQEMMQEGGRFEDAFSNIESLGYTGKKNIAEMQEWMAKNYPQEVVNYFTKNGQPLTAKHVDIIKNKYKNVFEEVGIPANKKSEDYTSEEKLKLQTALGDKANSEFLLEGFKDKKWDRRFPLIGVNATPRGMSSQAQSGIVSPTEAVSRGQYVTPEQVKAQEQMLQAEQTATGSAQQTAMPNLPVDFLLPPSAMQAIAKPFVPLGRIQPVKLTAEPMLAETERQRQTAMESLRASGLPPQIQEALASSQLASSQGAVNDGIAKTEQFNAQNQFQADQFNIGQASKEDLVNTQFAQDYQDKMMQTLSNQERDMRRYYNELNAQNRYNFNYIDRRNIANESFENFSTTGSDITYNPSMNQSSGVIPQNVLNQILIDQEIAKKQRLKEINAKSKIT